MSGVFDDPDKPKGLPGLGKKVGAESEVNLAALRPQERRVACEPSSAATRDDGRAKPSGHMTDVP